MSVHMLKTRCIALHVHNGMLLRAAGEVDKHTGAEPLEEHESQVADGVT